LWDRLFPDYFDFPLSVSLHQYYTLSFTLIFSTSGKSGKVWRPCIKSDGQSKSEMKKKSPFINGSVFVHGLRLQGIRYNI
jgi:hypothetical protein